MPDLLDSFVTSASSPLNNVAVVTTNDSTDLSTVSRAIYLASAGNVSVIMARDSAPVTIAGLAVGVWHPLRVKRVRTTGTTVTAGNILVGW